MRIYLEVEVTLAPWMRAGTFWMKLGRREFYYEWNQEWAARKYGYIVEEARLPS